MEFLLALMIFVVFAAISINGILAFIMYIFGTEDAPIASLLFVLFIIMLLVTL
jgi:hypothetical protein